MDKFTNKVLEYIRKEKLISRGDKIVIALSGGADSTALCVVLSRLRAILKADLTAAHIAHGLRGDEAIRDEACAKKLAKRLGLDFYSKNVDVKGLVEKSGMSEEEAARTLRYSALNEIGREAFGDRFLIATAHHADDQAETILFNMLRGSGLLGLGGMRPRRDNIIRPLLKTKKQDILSFLACEGIGYETDSTNYSLDYSRNRIRHVLLPEMRGINDKAAEHIGALGEKLFEADRYLRGEARAYIASDCFVGGDFIGLNKRILKEKEKVLRIYVIIEALKELGIGLKDWGEKQFDDIDALLFMPMGKRLDLPGGVLAFNQSGDTRITRQGDFYGTRDQYTDKR